MSDFIIGFLPTLIVSAILYTYIWEREDNKWRAGVVMLVIFIAWGFDTMFEKDQERCKVYEELESLSEDC